MTVDGENKVIEPRMDKRKQKQNMDDNGKSYKIT